MSKDKLSSLFWLVVGLISTYASFVLGLGSLREPGPGFLPFITGCFISLMALIDIFRSFLQERVMQVKLSELWKNVNWHRTIVVILFALGYSFSLEKMGFLISGFLLLFTLLKLVENLSWKKSILIPAITIGITYSVIQFLLRGNLPKGILGF